MKSFAYAALVLSFISSAAQAQSFQMSGPGLRDTSTQNAIALTCLPAASADAPVCSRMQFFEFLASDPAHPLAIGPVFESKNGEGLAKQVQSYAKDLIWNGRELEKSQKPENLLIPIAVIGGGIAAVLSASVVPAIGAVVFWQVFGNRDELFKPTGVSKAFTGSITEITFQDGKWAWIEKARKMKHSKYDALRGVLPTKRDRPEWIISL